MKKNKKTKDAWPRKELFLLEPKTLMVIIVTSVLVLLTSLFGEMGMNFLTSVLSPVPSHAPFDGTVPPIKQVPNWVKLSETERKGTYSGLPADKLISIPTYNTSRLATPTANLKWNNPNDDAIRNEKITYSVPYLGSYKLDGIEGSGSHPAVDIKVPQGTPIYSIANGTVIKAQISSGGFGNHIVIQHNNVPSAEDPNKLVTLFSSYSHMSSLSVNMYDVVTKGQLIGFSGMTGTSTTPHLHFQIDNDESKWHPYWPFTNAEMRAAGYSFFEAINNGLRKDNAIAYTVNPMNYVQKYLGAQQPNLVVAAPAFTPNIVPSTPADPNDSITFVAEVDGTEFEEGKAIKFTIKAFDDKGALLNKPTFKDQINLSLQNNVGKLNRTTLGAENLRAGTYTALRLSNTRGGKDKLIISYRNREFTSPEFTITGKQQAAGGFFLTVDKNEVAAGGDVKISLQAVDFNGNPLTNISLVETPLITMTREIGSLNLRTLTRENFTNGVATLVLSTNSPGSTEIQIIYRGIVFTSPTITVTEVQASAPSSSLIVQSPDISTEAPLAPVSPVAPEASKGQPFLDVPVGSQYEVALTELKNAGMVSGYSDGTFHPQREVTRAEATTFVLRAINEMVRQNISSNFPDVSKEAWYGNFVTTAFELGFVKGYPDGYFRPNSLVTMAEFFTMLFVGAKIDVDPQIVMTLPEGVNATDWFAPYFQEAIKKGLIEFKDNKAQPSKPLTRGDIADILYRLKKFEERNR